MIAVPATPVIVPGSTGTAYFIVALVGGVLGMCELLSRYRDEPWRAVVSWTALLYILINAGASLLALFLVNVWKPTFGLNPTIDGAKLQIIWILVAGLGAMAFFRSSIFTFRV